MARIRIVIQARLSSSRLPAKALLPVAGYPSAVLCALRAANLGHDTVLATSAAPGDDPLAQAASGHEIRVMRGDLDDVLRRFADAAADLGEGDLVVRLTADNLLPDGDFVQRLADLLRREQLDYLGTHSPFDGLPYGLSAEVFTVKMLRAAQAHALEGPDREHVTPWIKRHAVRQRIVQGQADLQLGDLSRLRVTLDCLDDYLRIAALFASVGDPRHASWRALSEAAARLPGAPKHRVPFKAIDGRAVGALSLGTAQLGMAYGATNAVGMPSADEALRLVKTAIDHGFTVVDTAPAYGVAESRLREALGPGYGDRCTVATKLDPLAGLSADSGAEAAALAAEASVFRSCAALGRQRLDVLMLHRWEHRRQHGGAIWRRLLELRDTGVIGSLGASVYRTEEALEALADTDIHHLQLPYNLLDGRWDGETVQSALAQRPDVWVHARSAFLQGLLLSEAGQWPAGLADAGAWAGKIAALANRFELSKAALCLAYTRAQPWLATTVVGVANTEQLLELAAAVDRPPLDGEQCRLVRHALAGAPEQLLNPALWPH